MPTLIVEEPGSKAEEPLGEERDTVDLLRAELDGYFAEMREFPSMPADQVMLRLSAFGSRAAEMRSWLTRREGRRSMALRTKEVEPFLEQCEFQFKVFSRYVAIQEMDLRMVGGQT